MQLFDSKDSPAHSYLFENMCLQVEHYQSIVINYTKFSLESATFIFGEIMIPQVD